MYHGEAYVMYLAGQETIRLAKPKEGMVAVSQHARDFPPTRAMRRWRQRFIHHALAPSAQTIFAEEYASAPSVSGVSLSEETRSVDAVRR